MLQKNEQLFLTGSSGISERIKQIDHIKKKLKSMGKKIDAN